MKKNNILFTMMSVILCILFTVCITSCGANSLEGEDEESTPPVSGAFIDSLPGDDKNGSATLNTQETAPNSSQVQTTAYPDPEVTLVPYTGTVEHIFFHEVIAYPALAFDGDALQKGFDENMVTASEYTKILDSLYAKSYILVNMNDVWSEYTDENGVVKMRKNTLMLPEGKRPLIISLDDISFYEYMRSNGFMHKLIIGDDGEIWAYGIDPDGAAVISQDLAAVPILDKFVREHPDFSLGGAKGCITLTGYEGILGYRTQFDAKNDTAEARFNRTQEIARVRPIVERLKATGWYFASHSYGHIHFNAKTLEEIEADALRWMDEVGSLVGHTQIIHYPYGQRLDGGDVYNTGPAFMFYHDLGFRIFASVGYESFSRIKPDIAAVVCDRIHIDGIVLRNSRNRYIDNFYDAAEVFDPARPTEYGKKW